MKNDSHVLLLLCGVKGRKDYDNEQTNDFTLTYQYPRKKHPRWSQRRSGVDRIGSVRCGTDGGCGFQAQKLTTMQRASKRRDIELLTFQRSGCTCTLCVCIADQFIRSHNAHSLSLSPSNMRCISSNRKRLGPIIIPGDSDSNPLSLLAAAAAYRTRNA